MKKIKLNLNGRVATIAALSGTVGNKKLAVLRRNVSYMQCARAKVIPMTGGGQRLEALGTLSPFVKVKFNSRSRTSLPVKMAGKWRACELSIRPRSTTKPAQADNVSFPAENEDGDAPMLVGAPVVAGLTRAQMTAQLDLAASNFGVMMSVWRFADGNDLALTQKTSVQLADILNPVLAKYNGPDPKGPAPACGELGVSIIAMADENQALGPCEVGVYNKPGVNGSIMIAHNSQGPYQVTFAYPHKWLLEPG